MSYSETAHPAGERTLVFSEWLIAVSILAAVTLTLLMTWSICTNAFGFGSELEERLALVMFAGWAATATASSDRSWLLLITWFGAMLLMLRELITSQQPIYFALALTAIVVVGVFELLNSSRGGEPLLILMQVVLFLFIISTTSLILVDLFMPLLADRLAHYQAYWPLIDIRILLSSVFVGAAVISGLARTLRRPRPRYSPWIDAPRWWKEDPNSAAEWLALPFLLLLEGLLLVVSAVVSITRYVFKLVGFILFETGKEAAMFARAAWISRTGEPFAVRARPYWCCLPSYFCR